MLLFGQVGKGTYWRAFYLARELVRQGHKVTLMPISRDLRLRFREREEEGVTIIETPDLLGGSLRSGWDIYNTLARLFWVRGKQFDIIHAFEARPVVLLPSLFVQRFGKATLIMDWCDWFGAGGSVEERPNPVIRTILRPVETFFEERFRTQADGSTAINTFLQKRLQQLGIKSETIHLLRNGSNLKELYPVNRQEARQRLGLSPNVKIIGYIGAIFQRDADLMAQAFDVIRTSEPDTRLLIMGYCNITIDKLVKFPQDVIQTGPLVFELINDYLAVCDILWLPLCNSGANQGRLPLKLNDYLAVGRPIVATSVGDIPNLIKTYDLGVVAEDTPDDLGAKVLNLLHNPAQCRHFERQTRHIAEKVFDWALLAGTLQNFYRKTMLASNE